MSEPMKRKQVRVYFDAVAERHLSNITNNVKTLSEAALMSEILAAALDAIALANYKITLPLKFQISDTDRNSDFPTTDSPFRVNEPQASIHQKTRK